MKVYRYSLADSAINTISENSDTGFEGIPGTSDEAYRAPLADPGIQFSFSSESLPGYGPRRPASTLEFSFPSDDQPRVQAWFAGGLDRVTIPESDTLRKNRRRAVMDCLSKYYQTIRNADLFASPFRLLWRFRMRDGAFQSPGSPLLMLDSTETPKIIITSFRLADKWISTEVELTHLPSRLNISWPALPPDSPILKQAEAIEIYASRQVDFHEPEAECYSPRSISIDGQPQRCWPYDSYPQASLLTAANTDSDFRLICEFPIERLASAVDNIPLPIAAGTLRLFDALPKLSDSPRKPGSTEGDSHSPVPPQGNLPGKEPRRIELITAPICMSHPEFPKQVRDLYLRGIFLRHNLIIELYGSHHREKWRLLCRSSRPWIRGLFRCSYRWYRVRILISLSPSDSLEALVFHYSLPQTL